MTPRAYGCFDNPESFVNSVVALRPQVAAFDCDGTLWFGDSGMKFLYWEIEEALLPSNVTQAIMRRYDEYLAGRVSEDEMCGEMVQIHRGIPEEKIRAFAARFAKAHVIPHYFPEMELLVERLHQQGCDVWAVSSTNNWVIEESVKKIGIPADRVLAVRVEIENGVATDRLEDITSGPGKARALRKSLTRPLDTSFGNSIFDLEMLELASTPFPVNPNDDLRTIAEQRGWRFYQPQVARLTSSTP
ncbi:MAG TPA: HAD-IB family phosphatase [Terriglobales bacterium]|nr:HAD-IB family phosphatase [Terriglobales bacterium]